jgi:hypothetical protein
MVFIPLGKVLRGGGEFLFCSDFVPFVLESNEYSKEPLFLITGHEV